MMSFSIEVTSLLPSSEVLEELAGLMLMIPISATTNLRSLCRFAAVFRWEPEVLLYILIIAEVMPMREMALWQLSYFLVPR